MNVPTIIQKVIDLLKSIKQYIIRKMPIKKKPNASL